MRYNRLYHEKVLQVDLAVCPGLPFHVSSVKTSPLPKTVADELGVDHQVCRNHVKRNVDELADGCVRKSST